MKNLIVLTAIILFTGCKKETPAPACDAAGLTAQIEEYDTASTWYTYTGQYLGRFYRIQSAKKMTDCEIVADLK
jgi:hypothetical protein